MCASGYCTLCTGDPGGWSSAGTASAFSALAKSHLLQSIRTVPCTRAFLNYHDSAEANDEVNSFFRALQLSDVEFFQPVLLLERQLLH